MVTMFDSTLRGPVLYPEQINCSWEGNPLLKYSSSPVGINVDTNES